MTSLPNRNAIHLSICLGVTIRACASSCLLMASRCFASVVSTSILPDDTVIADSDTTQETTTDKEDEKVSIGSRITGAVTGLLGEENVKFALGIVAVIFLFGVGAWLRTSNTPTKKKKVSKKKK